MRDIDRAVLLEKGFEKHEKKKKREWERHRVVRENGCVCAVCMQARKGGGC